MSNDKKTLADAQPGGRVRLGDGWTGWATQYPNKMPKLCGAREIAELNHYPEEGQRLLFLAENPVHVGDLVDAARAALPFVAFAYSKGVAGAEEAGRAIEAALSAQPSPGGQDALLDQARKLFDELGAIADDDRCVAILAAALAARQPVGQEPLWCLHVLGMDDVHPAPSKAHAEKAAAWHNEQFKDQAARLGISIEAKVVPWPHSAESHAADVAEFIPQWLIPQWQLDALEANAAPPAAAVDLGSGVKAIADERERQLQVEGFSRDCDQQYREGELARAATAYVQLAAMDLQVGSRKHIASQEPPFFWPWAQEWWKPVDARRDLVRAGALIAAQIDLIDSQAVQS